MFNIVIIYFFWQELCTCMTCRFAFGNISRTTSLLHNERFLKCRLTVLLIVEGTGEFWWICACPRLVVWAVSERNRSETERSLRPLDKNPLRAPTIFRTLRSPLAPRSAPLHSAHMLWKELASDEWRQNLIYGVVLLQPWGPLRNVGSSCFNVLNAS